MQMIRLGNKPPVTLDPEVTVVQAAQAMTERGVGAATVVQGTRVLGVVTERDVMRKVVALGRDPRSTRVRDIMSSPAMTITLKTTVASAAALMREHHIRHLVVLDEQGALLGMLALRYLLYTMMDDLERTVGDLTGQIMLDDAPGG